MWENLFLPPPCAYPLGPLWGYKIWFNFRWNYYFLYTWEIINHLPIHHPLNWLEFINKHLCRERLLRNLHLAAHAVRNPSSKSSQHGSTDPSSLISASTEDQLLHTFGLLSCMPVFLLWLLLCTLSTWSFVFMRIVLLIEAARNS